MQVLNNIFKLDSFQPLESWEKVRNKVKKVIKITRVQEKLFTKNFIAGKCGNSSLSEVSKLLVVV